MICNSIDVFTDNYVICKNLNCNNHQKRKYVCNICEKNIEDSFNLNICNCKDKSICKNCFTQIININNNNFICPFCRKDMKFDFNKKILYNNIFEYLHSYHSKDKNINDFETIFNPKCESKNIKYISNDL